METQPPFDPSPELPPAPRSRPRSTTRVFAAIALVTLLVAVAGFATWSGIERSREARLEALVTQAARHGTVVHIAVNGMSCVGCADAVQKELRSLPGVADCVVDYDQRIAEVRLADSTVTPALLVATLKKAGYGARLLEE